jgi:hypothetical protein
MMERHKVKRSGATIGWVGYETASDIWHEAVWPAREAIDRGSHRRCAAPPDVDGSEPHVLQLVSVTDHFDLGDYGPFLYCPTCLALITPPHDGYTYLDYPTEWIAGAIA